MKGTVLIVGATSGIGRALAVRLAASGAGLVLAGRNTDELERTASDCRLRFGVPVAIQAFEARNFAQHGHFYESCERAAPEGLDGVILCIGYLGPTDEGPFDDGEAARTLDVNFVGCVSVLERAARAMAARRHGFLCVVSSVAGDRIRRGRFLYGVAKAALNRFAEAQRAALAGTGVRVLLVKPGPVDTRMTYGLPGMALMASPEQVAGDIHRALRAGETIVYTPWFWRWIMALIKMVPEPIFRRLRL